MKPKYPNIKVKLVGEDGNSYAIIGRVQRAMKKAGVPAEEVSEFRNEAMSGDYSSVLTTALRWVEVE